MAQVIEQKGDFSTGYRLIWIATLAIVIGVICAFVAVMLTWLIGFFTNLFYYHQLSIEFHSPADAAQRLGWWAVINPIIGGMIIGLMARFGSERIRGHGIPEAMEAILIGSSRMSPKIALLKPLSSAVSIGSGGPFGSEGPIIMTGGACGSIIAQAFHMSAAERKTLLVAGAAGGMSATFATPLAAVLLAVELLLFEWKPRSLIPVALASSMACLVRSCFGQMVEMLAGAKASLFMAPFLPEAAPLFPVPLHGDNLAVSILFCAVLVGLGAGLLSMFLTMTVYAAEDAFHRLKFHWMWWPAIGGLVVGIGGYYQPHALGVGYDNIRELLQGKALMKDLIGLIVVKCLIWAIALGSGTSGGVLAPLLIMGGALGAIEATILPVGDKSLWPLVSMAAALGGTMRSPLTGVMFALELTLDIRVLPALLISSVVAHAFTVLTMKRSILTEKVARHGHHVSREYSVDPLERLSIGEIMTSKVITIPASMPVKTLVMEYLLGAGDQHHQGYPVVDQSGQVLGIVTKSNLLDHWLNAVLKGDSDQEMPVIAYDIIHGTPLTAYPWETCRTAAERMAQAGVGRLVVVDPEVVGKVVGIVTRSDLLKPRAQAIEEEQKRERFFGPGLQPSGHNLPIDKH